MHGVKVCVATEASWKIIFPFQSININLYSVFTTSSQQSERGASFQLGSQKEL